MGAHVLVPQEFLDGPDVVAVLEQVGREGVAQGVRAHTLGKLRIAGGGLHRALQG
jgi:hypothetical protein